MRRDVVVSWITCNNCSVTMTDGTVICDSYTYRVYRDMARATCGSYYYIVCRVSVGLLVTVSIVEDAGRA